MRTTKGALIYISSIRGNTTIPTMTKRRRNVEVNGQNEDSTVVISFGRFDDGEGYIAWLELPYREGKRESFLRLTLHVGLEGTRVVV